MFWKIPGGLRHLMLVGAIYMAIVSELDLDCWLPSRSQLIGGLVVAWIMLWRYMGDVASLTNRLAKRDQIIDDQRAMIVDLRKPRGSQ